MVPKGMQTKIIRNAHNIGHFGVAKTEALVKKQILHRWFKGQNKECIA